MQKHIKQKLSILLENVKCGILVQHNLNQEELQFIVHYGFNFMCLKNFVVGSETVMVSLLLIIIIIWYP